MTPDERRAFDALLAMAPAGNRIEFGVFRGATLKLIADHRGSTWGVDSFEGMAQPTSRDIKGGLNPYPKGRLAAPMSQAQSVAPTAHLVRGYVPKVLNSIDVSGFAFAHLDMDQFTPTKAALAWVYPRMLAGGILCCDDWFADRDWLAAGAINEFAREWGLSIQTCGRKAWFIC